jgi:hypothetical protein
MTKEDLYHSVFSKWIYKRNTAGVKRQAVMTGRTVYATQSIFCFKTVHSDWSYECIPITANIFEIGIKLPDDDDICLAMVILC